VSQISSFATAFVTVFAVIFVIFRSWRFGLLAIVPNLFPVLAIFGVMGWLEHLAERRAPSCSPASRSASSTTTRFISSAATAAKPRRRVRQEAIEIATAHEGRASLTTAIINSARLPSCRCRPTNQPRGSAVCLR
jgi:hypothetical protein